MIDYSDATIRVSELSIGRELIAANTDIYLVPIPSVTTIYADDPEPEGWIVTSQKYEVFIGKRLYARITFRPERKNLRLYKEGGKVKLWLAKRSTKLVAKID